MKTVEANSGYGIDRSDAVVPRALSAPVPATRGVVAAVDHDHAIDNGVAHTRRIRLGLLERVRLSHRRRIEDDQVGRESSWT